MSEFDEFLKSGFVAGIPLTQVTALDPGARGQPTVFDVSQNPRNARTEVPW